MKAVADTLAVARSNLIERVIGPARLAGLIGSLRMRRYWR